jgi:hypothetical protein
MGYEWYTLDDNLQRDQLIQGFSDFIWTERYNVWGDFEIKGPSTPALKALLQPETRITKLGSYYVMTIETVTEAYDQQGVLTLDVVGRSVEAWLDDRVAMPSLTDLTSVPTWDLTDTPGNIMRTLFADVCVSGALSADDTLDFYHSGTLLPSGSISEPGTSITVNLNPASLYTSIKLVGDTYALGFRIVRDGENGTLYFEVYTGSDRTTGQSDLPAVVFSPGLDNLSKTSRLTSTSSIKTVALVFASHGAMEVYAPGADSSATGRGRRVLIVDARDISLSAGPDLTTAMTQRGLQALAAQQKVYAFDGEISQESGYVYGVDYNLGDYVEERDSSGFGNQMMVTEQIFVSDAQGERSYPTLSLAEVVVPGTWSAWSPSTGHWADVDPSVHWADL